MYLVSACLCGFPCRYNAVLSWDSRIKDMVKRGLCVPVCPEVLGGLPVPRPPAEILAGVVRNSEGKDVTAAYMDGARKALLVGLQTGCTSAILKARSPSCGAGAIYDGTFTHTRVTGDGVFAALLRRHGFTLLTEEDL